MQIKSSKDWASLYLPAQLGSPIKVRARFVFRDELLGHIRNSEHWYVASLSGKLLAGRQTAVPLLWQFSITALRLRSISSNAVTGEVCMSNSSELSDGHEGSEGRREFLKKCGRFAAVTP